MSSERCELCATPASDDVAIPVSPPLGVVVPGGGSAPELPGAGSRPACLCRAHLDAFARRRDATMTAILQAWVGEARPP